ncbi:MAG: glycosyltransferase family 9 protein [Chloroflexi bacterium]|nr:glycosyltransferase family 9 protein [Chloroflexota bacterium]
MTHRPRRHEAGLRIHPEAANHTYVGDRADEIMLQARRIIITRALFLGDFLVATPAMRALRRALPQAEITWVGLPWMEELWRRYDTIDRFLVFPGDPDGEPTPEWDQFAESAHAYGYDLAIQWHWISLPTFVRSLGARLAAGFCEGRGSEYLDIPVLFRHTHEILRLLEVVERLKLPIFGTQMEFPLLPEDKAAAEALLPGRIRSSPLVVLHAGSRFPERSWSPASFARVTDYLAQYHGATVVQVGTGSDRQLGNEVLRHACYPPMDLIGKTSLGTLGAIIASADLFVGNDTGPAHLATALGTPSILIFRRCSVSEWAPLDRTLHRPLFSTVPCPACDGNWCQQGGHLCLDAVSTVEVIKEAEDLLAAGRPDSGDELQPSQ